MKIDGKQLAENIFVRLRQETTKLATQNITPHLAIVLVGDDPASESYVNQKVKKAEEIGASATVLHFPSTISENELFSTIEQLNNDNNIHGIIVQRPLPPHINSQKIAELTSPQKDIDGFHPESPYPMPLAEAVFKILEEVFSRTHLVQGASFVQWLSTKLIVVVGKGQTGGGPIITRLKGLGVEPLIVDSRTQNPDEMIKLGDIVVSTVGKEDLITKEMLKNHVVLIGVGMFRGNDGKFHGDYSEEDIQDIASFYTPIPGGVGPINVACLLGNLLKATEQQNL